MFGRDLVEQVGADSNASEKFVPTIVEKCIKAVETNGELLFSASVEIAFI